MAKFQAKSANVKAIETADAKRLVLEYVGSGIGVNQAMSMVNRQAGTLRQWLNRDPVFARNLEDARQQGASRELDGNKYDI